MEYSDIRPTRRPIVDYARLSGKRIQRYKFGLLVPKESVSYEELMSMEYGTFFGENQLNKLGDDELDILIDFLIEARDSKYSVFREK